MSKNKSIANLDKRLNGTAAEIEKLQQEIEDKQWIIEKTDAGLKALYGELQDANEELEKERSSLEIKIQDRTRELSELNQALEQQLTERKQVEETLKESQVFTRNLINSSLDMIIAVNTKRRITEFNPAAEKVFGYRREGVLGKHVNILYADPKEGLTAHKKTVMNGHHVQEIVNCRKNGETFPCLLSASVLHDSDGDIVGVMGVSRDITEHKRAEEALLESRAEYYELYHEAPIGYHEVDMDGIIIRVNQTEATMLGYSPKEILGRPIFDFINQSERLTASEEFYKKVAGQKPIESFELTYITKNGREIPVAIDERLIFDEQGNVTGIRSILQDITERKKAEEKLNLSDQIISHIENLVLVFDQKGKVIFTGPSITRVLSYLITEVLGDGWFELTRQDDKERKAEKAYIAAAIGDKEKIKLEPYERRIYDKDGRPHWILWQDAQGPGNTLIGIGHDITEYKNLESQLIQGEKLRAVGELAAGIAHEINSPIQFIGDNLHFLEDASQKTIGVLKELRQHEEIGKRDKTFSGVLDSQGHDFSLEDLDYYNEEIPKAIEQSLEGVGRISDIVQAMRTFAHPGGEGKIPADINQAIQSTVIITRNEWKYVANIELDLAPDLAPVPCLAGEINQVFLNLVVNAAQALQEMQEGGVNQEKGTIAISTRQEEDAVVVRINDTGPGIPEEIRPRIFEPFFTTKGVGRGTGQGLAIAYAVVVEKHGGTIYVETGEDQGTTFVVRLPLPPVKISNGKRTIS